MKSVVGLEQESFCELASKLRLQRVVAQDAYVLDQITPANYIVGPESNRIPGQIVLDIRLHQIGRRARDQQALDCRVR